MKIKTLGIAPSPFKDINAQDNTAGPVWSAQSNINSVQGKTVYIDVVRRMIGGAAAAIGFKDGTDYHEGGLAMVNDQRNAVYKEMVTLPDGSSFIPDGRDVVLNLPRGSKVLRADRTKRLMKNLGFPRYATGSEFRKMPNFARNEKCKPAIFI